MNKFLLRLFGAYTTFEKTENALRQANADNELLRNEIKKLRKELSNTNKAYEHQLQLYAKAEKDLREYMDANKSLSKKLDTANDAKKNMEKAINEGIEALQKMKASALELQKENEKLKVIADKAEEYREAHNRKRREKRARAKAEKEVQDNGEGKA